MLTELGDTRGTYAVAPPVPARCQQARHHTETKMRTRRIPNTRNDKQRTSGHYQPEYTVVSDFLFMMRPLESLVSSACSSSTLLHTCLLICLLILSGFGNDLTKQA